MTSFYLTTSFRGDAEASNPESRDSGTGPSDHPGMTKYELSERPHGKIAQPQIGIAAFFPDPEQRPVQGLPQQVVALAHGDADALAEIAALDKWPARERAAVAGIGAVDPERQRDRIAEDEVDLASPQRQSQRVVIAVGFDLGVGEHRLQIGLVRGAG